MVDLVEERAFVLGEFHTLMGYYGFYTHKRARQAYDDMPKAKDYEVAPLYIGCLESIKLNPGINQVDLSALMGHSTAVIARAMRDLETNGYLERERDSLDRRNNTLKLTRAGETYLKKGLVILGNLEKELLKEFSKEETELFKRLLERYIASARPNVFMKGQ